MRLIRFSFKRSFADYFVISLIETHKRTFPSITTEKCPVHINIFVAFDANSSTSDNFPQPL